jgi:hypothetical protein
MKKYSYILAELLFPLFTAAQPTISNMENFSTWMDIRQINCNYIGVLAGSPGANQTWDFTLLTTVDTLKVSMLPPGASSLSSQFPGTALVRRQLSANGDVQLGFINKTSSANYMLGIVDSASLFTTKYPNSILTSTRPFTYMSAVTDTFTTNYIFSGTVTGGGILNMTADGYGTLKLPNGTYNNVLRIKISYVQNDTGSVGPTPFYITTTNNAYRWYDNNHSSALLSWDSVEVVTSASSQITQSVSYLQSETVDIKETEKIKNTCTAFFDNNKLLLSGQFEKGRQYELNLFNSSGQKIYSSIFTPINELQSFEINKELPAGVYFASLLCENERMLPQLIKLIKP